MVINDNSIGTAISKNKVPIRLTKERWLHIADNHDYLAGMADTVLETIAEPDIICKGDKDELIAAKKHNNKYIVVPYKETNDKDGFVITAFITSKINKVVKLGVIWKKQ